MAGIGRILENTDLIIPVPVRNAAGFTSSTAQVAASVRAYREVRHASSAWVNRAAYTQATLLFRIRAIPGLEVTEAMESSTRGGRFVIDAVEVTGRYVEILAHHDTPEGFA